MNLISFFRSLNHSTRFIAASVVILFVLLNLVAQRMTLRLDLTRDGLNSVSDSTKKILSRPGQPILVEAYITKKLPGEIYAELQPIFYQLDAIERIGGNRIRLRYIDPDDEEDRTRAARRGIQGIPIEQAKDDEASVRMGYFGIYLQSGEKSAVVDLVDQGRIISDFEYRFLREVKRMTSQERRSGIGFLQAPGSMQTALWKRDSLPDKTSMFAFRSILETDSGLWTDVRAGEPVPEDVETLIVTGLPELDEKAKYYLDQFLMRGGNLLLMLRSFDFQLSRPDRRLLQMGFASGGGQAAVEEKPLKDLNEWLMAYGLELKGRILFEPELAAPELDIEGNYLKRMKNPAWAVYSHETGNFIDDPMFKYTGQVILPWFSDVQFNPNVQPDARYRTLLYSSDGVILRESASLALRDMQRMGSDPADLRSDRRLSLIVEVKGRFRSAFYERKDLPVKDEKNPFRPGQQSGTESTILIMGTPYLVSDIFLRNEQNMQIFQLNAAFLAGLIDTLQGDTDLQAARSRIRTIPLLEDPPEFILYFLGSAFEPIFQWFHILILPLLLSLYGWRRLSQRNRKRGLVPEDDADNLVESDSNHNGSNLNHGNANREELK
jgi:ABC-type uncharacterized transport system involved in gliding motility auxiliary subunit